MEDIKVIYEDDDILVVDKPAGIAATPEGEEKGKTLAHLLLGTRPGLKNVTRFGIVHRLDKETSGILLVAKSEEALIFLQKQFKNKTVKKEYTALVMGQVSENSKKIETLIGRSKGDYRKQKVYLPHEPDAKDKRTAITNYEVIERFKEYTLLRVTPETGRKHQIRCHMAYLMHPIANDSLYGFKGQDGLGLSRHFLHASCIKIKMLNGEEKEFCSKLSEDLEKVLNKLRKT